MRLKLPSYNGKDYAVLAAVILPFTLGMNWVVFGNRYFLEGNVFLLATVVTGVLLAIDFIACGGLAVFFKNRLPLEEQTVLRLTLMIVGFVLLSGIMLLCIFHAYELFPHLHYRFNTTGFIWAYVFMAFINIFLTLIMEGIARYNLWRDNLRETEQLNKAFQQSKIMALRSQVNPHFLFNSLNTLSSLISEDEQEAELFLNEMSKVYRYMLRNDDDPLVPLEQELRFVRSYTHLLSRRFASSLQVHTQVADADLDKRLPHLSLHTVIENAFSQNRMSRQAPLIINISSDGSGGLDISNNLHPKNNMEGLDLESGLDNLVAKYRLLGKQKLMITDTENRRRVQLPLLEKGVFA